MSISRKVSKDVIARATARAEKHHAAAQALGFPTAQAAYNAMGKKFLEIANKENLAK